MPTASRRSIRIFCVDPDPDMRAILEVALGLDKDIEVISAESLDSVSLPPADALIIALGKTVDAAGSDRTLRSLWGSGWTGPVLVLGPTADIAEFEIRDIAGAQVVGRIERPFDPIQLAERVRSLVAKVLGTETE